MSWLILLFPSLIYVVLFRKPMGKMASGADAKKIKASAHWKKGQIQNIIDTPNFGPGYGFWKISYEFFFRRKSIKTPRQITTIPYQTSEKKEEQLHLSWFGHSSYLIEVSRLKILMDPVLNGSAGPLRSMVKPFAFTNSIKVEDLGPIDYVIISHDHYDHLDYHSIKALSGSDCKFVCSLGVGSHLRYCGIEPNRILELHWGEKV